MAPSLFYPRCLLDLAREAVQSPLVSLPLRMAHRPAEQEMEPGHGQGQTRVCRLSELRIRSQDRRHLASPLVYHRKLPSNPA